MVFFVLFCFFVCLFVLFFISFTIIDKLLTNLFSSNDKYDNSVVGLIYNHIVNDNGQMLFVANKFQHTDFGVHRRQFVLIVLHRSNTNPYKDCDLDTRSTTGIKG